jgi:putative sterol carrier protein
MNAKSEVAIVFERLPRMFRKGSVTGERVFYFSLGDDEKWTVTLSDKDCVVKPGKTEDADCFFKASKEMFLEVWGGNHTPTAMDFMTGTIKSNNPLLLKEFVAAFKKG